MNAIGNRPSGFKRSAVAAAILALCGAAFVTRIGFSRRDATTHQANGKARNGPPAVGAHINRVVLAGAGRVEGLSEVVEVSSGTDGVLVEVRVREGQQVAAGDVLAVVSCGDLQAEQQAARAAWESAQQSRARLLRGSRDEERRIAAHELAAAEAALKQAQLHYQRQTSLYGTGDISRAQWEQAHTDLEIATASLRAAQDRRTLTNAQALPEEIARADAETGVAENRMRALAAKLGKCMIQAPIAGRILRCHLKAGETVSTVFPRPIISLADIARLRVRVEVDERDLGRLRLGQPVVVLADAFPDRLFKGHVSSVGSLMGRKRVRTGDPAEKSDRDVLEALVDLEETDERLVVGLRMTVRFLEP